MTDSLRKFIIKEFGCRAMRPFNLIEGGREELESTNEFKIKISEIRKELTEKYSLILSNERIWIARLIIKLRREIEIRRRIQTLSSQRNLHLWSN